VTIGALLGMAAHVEGKGCGIIDMAGLLVLGGDMVVAAGADLMATLSKDRGAVVVNSHQMMTMDFVKQPDFKLPVNAMQEKIRRAVPEGRATFVDATDVALQVMGDSIASNAFLLGVAYQKGLIPVGSAAIMTAIELNGVGIDLNKLAFQTGRAWVHDRASVEADLKAPAAPMTELSLQELIARRVALLTSYKSRRYAKRYEKLVDRVVDADQGPDQRLSRAVAHSLAMVYLRRAWAACLRVILRSTTISPHRFCQRLILPPVRRAKSNMGRS